MKETYLLITTLIGIFVLVLIFIYAYAYFENKRTTIIPNDLELVNDSVELFNDSSDETYSLYFSDSEQRYYAKNNKHKYWKIFKLLLPLYYIKENYSDKILKYVGVDYGEVTLSDVFLQGEFVKEI